MELGKGIKGGGKNAMRLTDLQRFGSVLLRTSAKPPVFCAGFSKLPSITVVDGTPTVDDGCTLPL